MVINLLTNIGNALQSLPITVKFAWTDSTVCLHWMQKGGVYKPFVTNRINKMNETNLTWGHVPTAQNPADVGSRGSNSTGEESIR